MSFVNRIERECRAVGMTLWSAWDKIARHARTGGRGVKVHLFARDGDATRMYRFGDEVPDQIAYAILFSVLEEMVKNDYYRFELEPF